MSVSLHYSFLLISVLRTYSNKDVTRIKIQIWQRCQTDGVRATVIGGNIICDLFKSNCQNTSHVLLSIHFSVLLTVFKVKTLVLGCWCEVYSLSWKLWQISIWAWKWKYLGHMLWDPVLYHSTRQYSLFPFEIGKMWLMWKHQICIRLALLQLLCQCSHKIISKYITKHFSDYKMQTMITFFIFIYFKLMYLYVLVSVFLHNNLSISPLLFSLFQAREGMGRCGGASGRVRMWL